MYYCRIQLSFNFLNNLANNTEIPVHDKIFKTENTLSFQTFIKVNLNDLNISLANKFNRFENKFQVHQHSI